MQNYYATIMNLQNGILSCKNANLAYCLDRQADRQTDTLSLSAKEIKVSIKDFVVANKIKPLEYFFKKKKKIFQGFFYCLAEMFLLSISSAYFLPCHLVAGEK